MYGQNRFADTRLIWTPHYHQQFAGERTPLLFFSLNSTRLIRTPALSMVSSLSILTGFDCTCLSMTFIDLYFCTVKFVSRLSLLTLGREVCCGQFPDVQIIYYTYAHGTDTVCK